MHGIDISNVENIDVKKLTLTVIASNLSRRESMINPAFQGDNNPSDPREMRLQNELLSAQSNDALTLLGLYENGRGSDAIEDLRDMVSDVIKDAANNPRITDVPIVDDNDLPMEDANVIIENTTVELRDYLEDSE